MTEQPEKIIALVKMLRSTAEEEIDCDEFWSKAALLAETDLTLDLPELKKYLQHLEVCPGCVEELELLKSVVAND